MSNSSNVTDTYCYGIGYPNYQAEWDMFGNLKLWIETPISFVTLFLLIVLVLISVFGKIDGTFRWCILNVAFMHILWPLFYKILFDLIMNRIMTKPLSKLAGYFANFTLGKIPKEIF